MQRIISIITLLSVLVVANALHAQDRSGITQSGQLYNHWMSVEDVKMQGSIAYIATGYSGLQIVDVRDPAAPVQISQYNTSEDFTEQVELVGDRAYVMQYPSGIRILDISEPSRPNLLGTIAQNPEEGRYNTIFAKDDLVYVALHTNEDTDALSIFDVTQPEDPFLIGSLDLPDWNRQMNAFGDVLYAACSDSGLCCIDITDPTAPHIIRLLNPIHPQQIYALTMHDTLLYVSSSIQGHLVYDISTPSEPRLAVYNDSLDIPGNLFFHGDTALAAGAGDFALITYDMSDPVHLRMRNHFGFHNASG